MRSSLLCKCEHKAFISDLLFTIDKISQEIFFNISSFIPFSSPGNIKTTVSSSVITDKLEIRALFEKNK